VVPVFQSIDQAEDYLNDLSVRLGQGELDSQSALELGSLIRQWIDSRRAGLELDLKISASNIGSDTVLRIEGGMPALPGTNINMAKEPSLNGYTNGNVIDHVEQPALTDSTESTPSEGQELEPNA
jgi:hypothetical protein